MFSGRAKLDPNRNPVIIGVSDADFSTPLAVPSVSETGALYVHMDSSDVAIGGGTEYTEGATDTTITGGVIMWEDASDTVVATSASKPLPVEIVAGAGSGGTAAADDADFTDGTTSGTPIMGVYQSTPSTVTDGDLGIVGITEDRQLKVKHTDAIPVTDNGGNISIDDGGNTITVDGTVAVTNAGLTALAGAIDTEVQVDVVGALPAGDNNIGNVDLASSIPAGTNNIGDVDILSIAAGDNNIGNVDVVTLPSLPAGTNAIGKLAANSGVDIGDVDVTSISAGTNTIGNVGLIGRTSGGLSIFRSIDLDESEEEVKGSAGQVFTIVAFNRTAAPLYLKLYNATAANVTVGTTTPVMTFVIPANADSDGAGFVHSTEIGYAFDTAISAAVTTGVADNDTGAPGANEAIVNIGYM